MYRIKKYIIALIAVTMIFSSTSTFASSVNDAQTLDTKTYPCQTECKLDHDHTKEICEIDNYGTLLDWSSIPYSWQYNGWDNSEACWNWGMWHNGLCYKTPRGTFDIDVRHKVALHSDGEYLYLDVIQATVNGSSGLGDSLNFTVDGNNTQFRFSEFNQLAEPGKHKIVLEHEGGSISSHAVSDFEGYLYIKNNHYNSEYELKIPLSELKRQNSNIDLDNVNEISFFSGNITYIPVTITGISTYPYILGILCVAVVGFIVYKKTRKKKAVNI